MSALLDGVMSPDEEERAWAHVHECHPCRDLVECEGWVKTRLATWGCLPPETPGSLHHTLLAGPRDVPGVPLSFPEPARSRPLVLIGGSALGAAVVGLLALGASPANAPQQDRRAPVTSLVRPSPSLDKPSSAPSMVRGDRVREKIGG